MDEQPVKKTRTKRIEIAVDGSGEIVTGTYEEPIRPKPRDRMSSEAFRMIYPEGASRLLGLDGAELRLLWYIITDLMVWEGPFGISPTEAGKVLDRFPQGVSRSIRILKERGVLIDRGRRMVMVHPRIAWFGHDPSRRAYLKGIENGD